VLRFFLFVIKELSFPYLCKESGREKMDEMLERFRQTIFPVLIPRLISALECLSPAVLHDITEIRLRAGQNPLVVCGSSDFMLHDSSGTSLIAITMEEIQQILRLMSHNSLYAFSEQLKAGFITIYGGHRIGLTGQAIIVDQAVSTLTCISSVNIRIAREIVGCADSVAPFLSSAQQRLHNILVISPPRCGKTTLLRDIARQISTGIPAVGLLGKQVGLVDERSEIAACCQGVPTVALGPRLDVLDGCPKALGMMMMIRSMAPDVIITDELGRAEDAMAIAEAIHAGVSVITSVHGSCPQDVECRPTIGSLLKNHYFDIYVVLNDQPVQGTVTQIISGKTGKSLLPVGDKGVKVCG
jgi:stage III sporulation protein AA